MTKLNLFYLLEEETLELFLKNTLYFETFYNLKKHFSKSTIVNFSKLLGQDIKNNNFKKILKKKISRIFVHQLQVNYFKN